MSTSTGRGRPTKQRQQEGGQHVHAHLLHVVADVPTAVGLLERLDEVEGLVVIKVGDEKPAWVPRAAARHGADAGRREGSRVPVGLHSGRVASSMVAPLGASSGRCAGCVRCAAGPRLAVRLLDAKLLDVVWIPVLMAALSFRSTAGSRGVPLDALPLRGAPRLTEDWFEGGIAPLNRELGLSMAQTGVMASKCTRAMLSADQGHCIAR